MGEGDEWQDISHTWQRQHRTKMYDKCKSTAIAPVIRP